MTQPKTGLKPGQCYQADTYYQILEVSQPDKSDKRINQNIFSTILAKHRGTGDSNKAKPDSFDEYKIDLKTQEKLEPYYRHITSDKDILSSYLPSPGVVFPDALLESLTINDPNKIELNNYYDSLRSVLISRKISQLIAKTWWAYLEAKNKGLWEKFTAGEWINIEDDILDGLIAREIFIYAGQELPDKPGGDNPNIYIPLTSEYEDKNARFLILPSSNCWGGINMSLLFAGQAYRKLEKTGEYHQISQPIMSTGEIVLRYSFQSDWSKFNGELKELRTNQQSPRVMTQAVIPYPPIPTEAELNKEDIKTWADAKDEGGDLPFYETEGNDFLMDVGYYRSPYPYIPLSTT